MSIIVSTFYRFVTLSDYVSLRQHLHDLCMQHGIKGTILLAEEGINSTVSGTRAALDSLYAWFDGDARLAGMEVKEHTSEFYPFQRLKVRLKQEIVHLGVPGVDGTKAGTHLDAEAWDALIQQPDVVVIDTRNDYEVQLGTFQNAVNPRTMQFDTFPQWVAENLSPEKQPKVAMFCTGGIRCEKSTAYLKSLGFPEVYHLKGGILKYLEETANQNGLWQGSCFVFDDRIALDENLQPTGERLCRFCSSPAPRNIAIGLPPLAPGASESYVCPSCAAEKLDRYNLI